MWPPFQFSLVMRVVLMKTVGATTLCYIVALLSEVSKVQWNNTCWVSGVTAWILILPMSKRCTCTQMATMMKWRVTVESVAKRGRLATD